MVLGCTSHPCRGRELIAHIKAIADDESIRASAETLEALEALGYVY